MKNKGFTLMELLAVLVLLAVLALMIFPAVEKYLNQSREESNQVETSNIIAATKNWEADNTSKIPDNGETYTLTLGELIDGGYIEDVINHKTDEKLSRETKIIIKNKNETFEYEVQVK